MAAYSGSDIVNSGLALYFDGANPNCYNPNMLEYSQTFNTSYWSNINSLIIASTTELAPDGTNTATTATDDTDTTYKYLARSITVPNDNQTYYLSIFVKKTPAGVAPGFAINTSLTGGTPTVNINQRLNTGTGVATSATATSEGNYWKLTWSITNNSSGNTSLNVTLYPAARLPDTTTDTVAATGSATFWGFMISRTLLPYVPNFGKNYNTCYNLVPSQGGTYSFVGAPSYSFNAGGALAFDGSTNYATANKSASTLGATDTYSLEIVTRRTGTINTESIVFGWQGFNCGILMDSLNRFGASDWYSNGAGGWLNTYAFSSVVANTGTWYHVVSTFNAQGAMRIYVNGVLRSSVTVSGFTTSSGNVWYGRTVSVAMGGWNHIPYRYPGEIAITRFYTKELTQAEITQNFEANRSRFNI
jgi:hypothetical protein